MNRPYVLTIIALLLATYAFPQMYILNEDFSGASGTTPPAGWNNIIISGTSDDQWHFDNPGDRILPYPVTEPFAVFDSDSTSGGNGPEEIALETPLFDASTSNYILLYFIYALNPGSGGTARIEAYDGDVWHEVASYTTETDNPAADIVDLSAICGGLTNGRLRFIWSGNGSGFWALDNIRIYASLPLDAGMVSIDNPSSPVTPGLQNVEISLGNFGYNTISSTKIKWTADGVPQPDYNWNGSLGFGQTQSNIVIGTYNFQAPVIIKVWHSSPNGMDDLNPYNDTISKFMVTTLCGTYTVGGADGDFDSFSQVAEVLNLAGITCPVEFIVRDGVYYEMLEIREIPGASGTNAIKFRSESGDSTLAMIRIHPNAMKYEPMIYLNGARHITFESLGFSTGSQVSFANNAIQMQGCENIQLNGCFLEARNQFDACIAIQGGSKNVQISGNYFNCYSGRAKAITVSNPSTRDVNIINNQITGAIDWGYATIHISNFAKSINIIDNSLDKCYRALHIENSDSISVIGNLVSNSNFGVVIESSSDYIDISGNRFLNIKSHQEVPSGTSGISAKNSSYISVSNNFIYTTGSGPVSGINLLNTVSSQIYYNSVNITNTDLNRSSNGISLSENNSAIIKNNIFRIKNQGTPVYLGGAIMQLDLDYNDYYSPDHYIGFYNGTYYKNLEDWTGTSGMDDNSKDCPPFFTSDTDLSINQAILNNAATIIAGITTDIDGVLRDPANPDIGAKEYDKCTSDAGINAVVNPGNPLAGGVQEVIVQLQNQGTDVLNNVVIEWEVNGVQQPSSPWSGMVPEGANLEISIGNFNFQPGILYTIKAWTSLPNNAIDCNYLNDTISSQELAVPLCGSYTIGGNNPDFATISEAISLLNLAGVTCPVNLMIRNGIYRERLFIMSLPGSSEINTVTFQSENDDSTLVTIQIIQQAQTGESMLIMEGSGHIVFRSVGLFTGATNNSDNNAVLIRGSKNIRFEGCNFQMSKISDLGISIKEHCEDIEIRDSRFVSQNAKAMAIEVSGQPTRNITIAGNRIFGASEWTYPTISISDNVRKINIFGNHIEDCYRAVEIIESDTILIVGNNLNNCNDGIYIGNWCSEIEISGNRLLGITNHQNSSEGTSGISIFNTEKILVLNNFIHASGSGPVIGLNIQSANFCKIHYNSINLANDDIQSKSKAINLKASGSIIARNNIFKTIYPGAPVYITNSNQVDFDYNDYYSLYPIIGYLNGNLYPDLSSWITASNMDHHSVSVEPFFFSVTDPSINQVLLNNAGIAVAETSTDIDGNPRNPSTPDIGAREYNPCETDAGINAFTAPVPPLTGGAAEVRVILQNQGAASLTSAKINWQVNGEIQPQHTWSGNLAPAANQEVLIGNYHFEAGNAYKLKAWTSHPDNLSDCNVKNDTIFSRELSGPLCGIYTIGGNDPDFGTLAQAAGVLNASGITCPVEFIIRDGIYDEKLIINDVAGSSSENTITFRSENNDNSLVTIRIQPEAGNFEPMILLSGAKHIHFRGLGLHTGTESGIGNCAVQIEGADDVSLEDCYINIVNESDIGINILGASRAINLHDNRFGCIKQNAVAINITGVNTRSISLLRNKITGASIWGNTLVRIGNGAGDVRLHDNMIEKSYRAMYFIGADSLEVSGNTIKSSNSGIYIDNACKNVRVENNRLINIQSIQSLPDGTSGIFALNTSSLDIINNYIHTIGTGPVLGLNLQGVNAGRVLYNSINTTNTDPQGKSRGIYFKNSDSIQLRNNIFNIKSSGIPIDIDVNVTYLSPDYNNYFNPAGLVGKVNGQTYNNLFTWGQTVQGDANSKVVNPYFKSDTIPLPYQRILNGSGMAIPGIIYDMEGKLRHIQAPDIGCIEFFVDYGVLELLSPDLNCYHPDVDSVIVYLRQFGDVPFENLKVAYQMDNGAIHIDTIPGPLIYDITHTFGTTETISAPGEYLFKVWLINTLDDNINNDTLKAWRYSKPPPIVSISYDNECTGWEVHFTGHATIEEPYYVDKYEWLFGDGDTSYLQNPVHSFQAAGTYDVTLRAYSNIGCYSEEFVPVVISPDFQGLQLDYTLVNENCHGDGTGSLELFPSGGNPPYTIYLDDQVIASNPVMNFQPGKYEVRIVDSKNCTRTDSVESISQISMDPQIFADPLTGYTPLTVNFDFTANDPASWVWHFTEEISDTSKQASFTFTEYGNHEVILGVNSGPPFYCTETTTINIFVDIIVTIEANSVFTPNVDGHNDFFEVKSVGLKSLLVKIFNQWGNKVYQITEVDGKWDGKTSSGAEAPDGTYFYSIVATGVNEKIYEQKGSVLLLRNGAAASPNPVTGHVRITSYETLESPVNVSVYSIFGQLSYSKIIDDPANITLDLSLLPGGIYIVKASDGKRDCYVRIIKN